MIASKNNAMLCLILAVACMAASGVFVRFSHVGPAASGAWRIIIALPILMALNQHNRRDKEHKKISWGSKDFWLLQIAGACLGLDITVWNISFFYTTLAEANLLVNLVPFIAIPMACLLFKERISGKFILGLAIAMVGIVLLMFSHSDHSHDAYLTPSRHIFGNLLAISAAVFYSFFIVTTKFSRGRYKAIEVIIAISPACIFVLLSAAMIRGEVILPHSLYGVLLLIGLAVTAQIFGQTLVAYSVGYLSVALTSILMLLQPIISAIYAYFIFHEKLSLPQLLYIATVLVGIHWARTGLTKEK
ncbi:MAG: DMT family transporter [Gammaproteobacteria bacterium]|nr:DMT family transporter [Gammaproteobacteria bacterium]